MRTLDFSRSKQIGAALLLMLQIPLAWAAEVVPGGFRWLALVVFATVIGLTLVVTYLAARRGQSAADFYTAGGGISGLKNGFAIAGDYLSAAAFLGVSGLVALYGFDGVLYVTGFFVAFVPVLLLIAEPCRNLGRYTLGDILAVRNGFRQAKLAAAVSGITVSIFYLIPQIVGGAVLIKALVGVDYEVSVVITGVLMLVYVFFGGMRATTWVQIIKAVLLLSTCFVLVALSWAPLGFSLGQLTDALDQSPAMSAYLKALTGDAGTAGSVTARYFEPGLFLKKPLEQLSLGLALILGTAAMPHILMRFFTVPDARTARSSVLWAMLLIGVCHLLIIAIGLAAAHYVGSAKIAGLDKGGNLAAPLLAQLLGGGPDSLLGNFMLAFVAAVAFATIVAVVAGLTLAAASSLAHDVYVGVLREGRASPDEEVKAAKAASVLVAAMGIMFGLMAKGQNVAHLVALAFAIAASANFPALFLTLYWKRCNTVGVVAGVVGGTVIAIGMVLVSPNMQYPALRMEEVRKQLQRVDERIEQAEPAISAWLAGGARDESYLRLEGLKAERQVLATQLSVLQAGPKVSLVGLERPWIELRNPGIVSIPLGFLLVILGSLLSRSAVDHGRNWNALRVRRYTGLGRAEASLH